jgi:hypothetical protein
VFYLVSLQCDPPGDNIFGADCDDSAASQVAAFAPSVNAAIPWAAVLGNHDQEGNLNREQLIQQIVKMNYTLTRMNPFSGLLHETCPDSYPAFCSCNPHLTSVEGFGFFNVEVGGVECSELANKSVLNLYFLDSGDQSNIAGVEGYDWIKSGQREWFTHASAQLQVSLAKHV